jgi:hypothetical protein
MVILQDIHLPTYDWNPWRVWKFTTTFIFSYMILPHKKKITHVLHSHISLFGHGLISMFLNVCELLLAVMMSHTGLGLVVMTSYSVGGWYVL